MSNIDKQAVQAVADLKAGYTLGHADVSILNKMARIALASLEAEDAAKCSHQWSFGGLNKLQSQKQCVKCGRVELATQPAPVSVPDEMTIADVIMEIDAKDADRWTGRIGFQKGWNACRAAMLQGVEPVTTAYKLRDAVEIIRNSGIEIDAEKIFAERDALNTPDCWCRTCRPVTVTDMRFVVCPDCGNKRCPHANDHRNACTGSNEPGQEGSAYPAAPQQEVESQIRKGKTVAMEEWELGARLTKHRFKP